MRISSNSYPLTPSLCFQGRGSAARQQILDAIPRLGIMKGILLGDINRLEHRADGDPAYTATVSVPIYRSGILAAIERHSDGLLYLRYVQDGARNHKPILYNGQSIQYAHLYNLNPGDTLQIPGIEEPLTIPELPV